MANLLPLNCGRAARCVDRGSSLEASDIEMTNAMRPAHPVEALRDDLDGLGLYGQCVAESAGRAGAPGDMVMPRQSAVQRSGSPCLFPIISR